MLFDLKYKSYDFLEIKQVFIFYKIGNHLQN